jgi:hypothetical protein
VLARHHPGPKQPAQRRQPVQPVQPLRDPDPALRGTDRLPQRERDLLVRTEATRPRRDLGDPVGRQRRRPGLMLGRQPQVRRQVPLGQLRHVDRVEEHPQPRPGGLVFDGFHPRTDTGHRRRDRQLAEQHIRTLDHHLHDRTVVISTDSFPLCSNSFPRPSLASVAPVRS